MKTRLLAFFAVLGLLVAAAFAESPGEIRDRMAQRVPALDDLKAKGMVGENNRGFAEVRDNGTPVASSLVADENRDREAVYALIAKDAGSTPDSVGRARAKKIAANSVPGVWVQDENGRWAKK